MYCFRCGRKLPGREINCPDCDTPQKKRRRRHRRMVLGLFIFLAGAFTGRLFDTYLFKGEAWKHSFLSEFFSNLKGENNPSNATSTGVTVEMKYSNSVKLILKINPRIHTIIPITKSIFIFFSVLKACPIPLKAQPNVLIFFSFSNFISTSPKKNSMNINLI